MSVYLQGRSVKLHPSQAIGKGGEADVFRLGSDRVLKLFKTPDHPDYQGQPEEQEAARCRLVEHQQKLRCFPANLPARVVQPLELATDRSGQRILGYTMPLAVETCAGQPQIASNGRQRVWLHQGQLWRDGRLGPEYVGDVLANQTRIWLGSTFGFGFYRAGRLSVAFTFSPERAGLNDRVALEFGSGQLLEATCVFGGDRAWFLWRSATPTGTLCRAAVIDARGAVLAQQSFDPAQTPWLAHLGGLGAVGPFLLAATDEGVTCSEVQQGQLVATQTFPDAEPFVDAATQLLPSAGGLYAVSAQQIQHLRMT